VTIKVLTFTTLYPNAVRPYYGIFVETRLRQLIASGSVEARVVAPVPWFPSMNPRYGRYADYARVPREEERSGIKVFHPRYPLLPKLGMSLAPLMLARAVKPLVERIDQQGRGFDLIDAHYFYPDGVAAVMLGRSLDKPVVITARGTDLNLISQYLLPRRMIQWAACHAAAMVTVSAALKGVLLRLGARTDRIEVLRNGVDLHFFRPVARHERRAELGLSGRTLLSVGNLVPLKGHDLAIRALPALPDVDLLIAGEGPEKHNLRTLAAKCGVAQRVRFLGTVSQLQLRDYYGAVDALVLASSREGWPNVLLESMACGTPVIATNVGGVSEIVTAPEAGILLEERTPVALTRAVEHLFANYPDNAATRRYAERFSWEETTRGQLKLFEHIICHRRRVSRVLEDNVDERS
jgi:glycosyltransferase involved in cell wall biosynthesis